MTERFDIVIVGGGLVGASMAVGLSSLACRIALIDARLPSPNDKRLFALNQSSCFFLKRLGVWPSLEHKVTPIHEVHVSQAQSFGMLKMKREMINLDALGHVIPAYDLEQAFESKINDVKIVSYRPATLISLEEQQDCVQLILLINNREQIIETPLLFAADGSESTVREKMGMETKKINYGQSALVTRVTLNRSHQHIAYERFNSQGAIAMLPLGENECASIWTAPNELINFLYTSSDEDFLKRLQSQFGYRLGRLSGVAQRFVYPLIKIEARKPHTERIYLLGNALHTLHPIAAQGFNLALFEVAVLIEAISEWLSADQPFNILSLSEVYRRFQTKQKLSINFSHLLAQFSSKSNRLGNLMGMALFGLDRLPFIKRRFMQHMLGRIGKTPRLLLSVNDYET